MNLPTQKRCSRKKPAYAAPSQLLSPPGEWSLRKTSWNLKFVLPWQRVINVTRDQEVFTGRKERTGCNTAVIRSDYDRRGACGGRVCVGEEEAEDVKNNTIKMELREFARKKKDEVLANSRILTC